VAVLFCYPPDSVYKQSIYTVLADQCGISGKTAVPDDEVGRLRIDAESTGLFGPAGRELKCLIDRPFSHDEVSKILSWCEEVARAVGEYGAKE